MVKYVSDSFELTLKVRESLESVGFRNGNVIAGLYEFVRKYDGSLPELHFHGLENKRNGVGVILSRELNDSIISIHKKSEC